jgi:hypothetical protein
MIWRRGGSKACRVVLLLLHCAASVALADGKVFARALAVPVTIPDQRTLIHYSNGLEKLVIETSFQGQGTNFAWVVPLPSPPAIEAVSTHFFPRLAASFQPEVIHPGSPWWLMYLSLGAGALLGLVAYRRKGRAGCLVLCALGFLGLLVVALLLPLFVRAKGGTGGPPAVDVRVLDRRVVGFYDTTVIAGTNGQALLAWLNTNSFFTPTGAAPVISEYARQGWVFVAVRLSPTALTGQTQQAHPLAFTFRSTQAVYPLRLTGVENDKCSIELFVFGDRRAEADGFQVEHCGQPLFPRLPPVEEQSAIWEKVSFSLPRPGEYRVRNPEVRRFVQPAPVATKLLGHLSTREMQTDVVLRWIPYRPTLPVYHSAAAAITTGANWAVGTGTLATVLLILLARKEGGTSLRRGLLVICLVAVLVGAVRWATVTTTPIRVEGGWLRARNGFQIMQLSLREFAEQWTARAAGGGDTSRVKFEDLQAGFAASRVLNVFTQEPIRLEATPGNLLLEETQRSTRILWHDIDGVPREVAALLHFSARGQ